MSQSDIGLLGLGVMGKSLARNLASRDLKVSVYNMPFPGEENKVQSFVEEFRKDNFSGAASLEEFISSLQSPKKVIVMITAGKPVDEVIEKITPLLSPGDTIIDGGNSHYLDTERRYAALKEKQLHFVGLGVSGGEEGALKGPSLMPGCSKEAYDQLSSHLHKIAAIDRDNKACVTHVGSGGSGHFVKMVHNGLEYADMQLLAEVYGFLKNAAGYENLAIAELFETWSDSEVSGYLLEITIDILKHQSQNGATLDLILDAAGNKGTGKWVVNAALDLGVPIPTISEAVFARFLSAMKSARTSAHGLISSNRIRVSEEVIGKLKHALQIARIMNYTQGFNLINEASSHYNWEINSSQLADIWKAGCIIRSELLYEIGVALNTGESKPLLFQNPPFAEYIKQNFNHLEDVINAMNSTGNHVPVFNASYQYLIGMTNKQSTANMIQAQRDYFGAHQYERVDQPRGKFFHTNWVTND